MVIPVDIRPPQPQEQADMYYQRWSVLRQPLGKPLGSEQDRFDGKKGSDYAIALTEKKIVGSARLRLLEPETGSIAYVAVLPNFSRQGIGTQIIQYLLNRAQAKQFQTVRLRSRLSAQAFYEKLGFTATTEPFIHIGIPHVDMEISMLLN